VLPALAIADALVAGGHRRDEIVYIGARRGIETRLVPPTGYAHHFLHVTGLQRRLTPRNIVNDVLLPFTMARAVLAARRLLVRLRPAVVVSVGGYASFPATFAAMLQRAPFVVVSYDRRPGLVSKLMARRAAACAVAFEGSPLPRATLTGAPVRQEVIAVDRQRDRDAAREQLGLPTDRFVFAVFGGSLGSQRLNEIVVQTVERLAERGDLAIYHVVGERNVADAAPGRDGAHGIMYRVLGYEDRMPLVYAAADLMMTRAGAATIAELAAVGMPAVIVPWPGAAENHQVDNARELSDGNAAVLIEEQDLTVDFLIAEIERMLSDPARLAEMSTAAAHIGERHRSGALVDVIEAVARS